MEIHDNLSSREASEILPICNMRGRAVNMSLLGLNPFDYRAVLSNSSQNSIVRMAKAGRDVMPPGEKTAYLLPNNVEYRHIGTDSVKNDLFCGMGSEMAPKLGMSVGLSGSYAGVSMSTDSQHSYESSLQSNSLYGIYSFDQQAYWVHLDRAQWYNYINQGFVDAAKRLPPWDKNPRTYQEFKTFFETWGTHMVVQCHMGTRYQLKIETEEVSSNMKEDFTAHVKAEYQGIMGGSYGVENENEYRQYLRKRKTQCKVLGGNAGDAGLLANDPTNKEAFQKWQRNRPHAADAMTSARIQSLKTFLEGSSDVAHKEAGERLAPALDYVCNFTVLKGKLEFIPISVRNEQLQWGECKITGLPGLEIIPENKKGWRVTNISPSHVKVEQSGSDEGYVQIDITIKAPTHAVDVSFNGGVESGSANLFRYLLLSAYGPKPEQFYTRIISSKRTGDESTINVSPSLKAWGDFSDPKSMVHEQGLEAGKELRIGEMCLKAH